MWVFKKHIASQEAKVSSTLDSRSTAVADHFTLQLSYLARWEGGMRPERHCSYPVLRTDGVAQISPLCIHGFQQIAQLPENAARSNCSFIYWRSSRLNMSVCT